MEKTIPGMLEKASHQFGDKGYLFEKNDSGWHGYSYSQARQLARAFAAALIKHEIKGPGAILAEGRPSWVISELGILIAGLFSVPLSIKLSAEEIKFRLEHSRSTLLVCSRMGMDKVIQALAGTKALPKVIFLDNDSESMDVLERSCGLERGKDLFTFEQFIEEGTEWLDNPQLLAKLESIEGGISPNDVATVCYTSGTTGNPKGIMLSHGNYFANCRDSLLGFPIPLGLRMFVVLPIDHSFAHTIALYAALQRQFALYFVDARGGSLSILRNIPLNIREIKPDLMLTVPALTQNFQAKIQSTIRQKGPFVEKIFNRGLTARIFMNGNMFKRPPWYQRILPWFPWILAEVLVFKKVRDSLGNLGFAIGGGAHLDLKQQEFFSAIGIPVYQGYGLSEASPVVSTNSKVAHKLGTSGRVLPNVECQIVDEKLNVLGPNQKGQIRIKGENIMKGYLHNEQATEQVIRDGWLYTGDLGTLDEDGFLLVSGREKALLITSDGEKYSPEELEGAIVSSSQFMNNCMLWCDHKPYTVALITLKEDAIEQYLKTNPCTDLALARLLKQDFEKYLHDPAYKSLFPRQWLPGGFAIVPKQFSDADGTMNSTMKLVRHGVCKLYQDLIDYQYTDTGKKPESLRNLEVLRARFGVSKETI